MFMIRNSLFNFIIACVVVSVLTKLLTLGILFLAAVRALVVARLVMLDILSLTLFILALREAVVAIS